MAPRLQRYIMPWWEDRIRWSWHFQRRRPPVLRGCERATAGKLLLRRRPPSLLLRPGLHPELRLLRPAPLLPDNLALPAALGKGRAARDPQLDLVFSGSLYEQRLTIPRPGAPPLMGHP